MSRHLLDHDPLMGTTDYFLWDPVAETFQVQTEMHHDVLFDWNAHQRNEGGRFGDLKKVASIPLNLYFELKQQGIVDDQAAFRRWLNDRDNRHFRTHPGTL